MNVKQLREALDAYPDDLEILQAEDPEGNGFRPLQEIQTFFIEKGEAKHGWTESIYDPTELDDEEKEYYEPRLILWP